MLKVPTAACWVGCPGAGSVVDWPYVNPKKRADMHSEEDRVPIDQTRREKGELEGQKKGGETRREEIRRALRQP